MGATTTYTTPSATATLTTLAKVQAYVTTSATSGQINTAIGWATKLIQSYTDRDLIQTTYTDAYDGNCRRFFYLRQYPVISITSVTLDDEALVENTDYRLTEDSLALDYTDSEESSWIWTRGYRNLVVVYTAGYATIPVDLEWIATQLTIDVLNAPAFNRGLKSETWKSHTYINFDQSGGNTLLAPYAGILAAYRRLPI